MKNVMVVGGAGYIGSVLLRRLLEENYNVTVVDKFYYERNSISPFRTKCLIIEEDMRSIDPSIIEKNEILINLGGISNDPSANYNPVMNKELNTEAAVKLAEISKRCGVQRYIFASSCSIYDKKVGNGDELMTEESEVSPTGYYATSKYEAEQRINQLRDDSFLPIILRKGTVFGLSPRMRFDLVVNTMVKDALLTGIINLHQGGEMWRPMIDIEDVANAYLLSIQADITDQPNVFNIYYKNFRISEVGLRVANILRKHGIPCELKTNYNIKTIRDYRVHSNRAKEILGFEPTRKIEDAVVEIAEYYQSKVSQLLKPKFYNIEQISLLNI